jgi:toxin ParE1/3/4
VKRLLRFEEEADAEYRAAARWYEQRRAGLGVEFLDAVDATLARIAQMPHAGAPVKGASADLPVRRGPINRFPYHAIYLEVNGVIRVLAIAHDRGSLRIGMAGCNGRGLISSAQLHRRVPEGRGAGQRRMVISR